MKPTCGHYGTPFLEGRSRRNRRGRLTLKGPLKHFESLKDGRAEGRTGQKKGEFVLKDTQDGEAPAQPLAEPIHQDDVSLDVLNAGDKKCVAVSGNRRSPLGKQARQVGDFADSLTRKVEVIYGEVPRGALNEHIPPSAGAQFTSTGIPRTARSSPPFADTDQTSLWPLTNLSKNTRVPSAVSCGLYRSFPPRSNESRLRHPWAPSRWRKAARY